MSRKGSGFGIDYFSGATGSRLAFDGVYRWRYACSDPATALAAARSYPRPAEVPGANLVELRPACFQGRCGDDWLHYRDFAVHISADSSEANTYLPGYDALITNSTRVCETYIDAACPARDACLVAATDEWLQRQAGGGGGGALSARDRAAAAGGAAAGAAVLGAIVAAAAWGLWARRRRRSGWLGGDKSRRGDIENGLFGPAADALLPGHGVGWRIVARHVDSGSGGANAGSRANAGSGGGRPSTDADAGRVQLGVLLGAGSFGRVYKGRWRGRDVAVKVMQHDARTAERVANEVDLMLSFKHPNVIEAYDFVTWTRGGASGASNSQQQSQSQSQSQQQSGSGGGGGGGVAAGGVGRKSLGRASSGTAGGGTGSGTAGAAGSGSSASAATAAAAAPPEEDSAEAHNGRTPPRPPRLEIRLSESAPSGVPGPGPGGLRTASGASQADAASGGSASGTGRQGSWSAAAGAGAAAQVDEINFIPWVPSPPAAGGANAASGPLAAVPEQQQQTGATPPPDAGSAGSGAGAGGAAPDAQTWLILELADRGTLADASRRGDLGPGGAGGMAELLARLSDVAAGMAYLHGRSVLHGDLKAANCLLASAPSAPFGAAAKVSDFGLSRALNPGATHRSTRTCGTVTHQAPELLRLGKLSAAADVYAFAILMW